MDELLIQDKKRIEEMMPTFNKLAVLSSFILNFCNNKNSEYKTIKLHKRTINRPFLEEVEEEFTLKNIENVVEQFLENTPEYVTSFEISKKFKNGTVLTQEEIDVLNRNTDVCVFDVSKKINKHLEPLITDSQMCGKFSQDAYKQNKLRLQNLYTAKPTDIANNIALKNYISTTENALNILSKPLNNYIEAFTSDYQGLNFTEFAVNEYIRKYTSIEDARFSKPLNSFKETKPLDLGPNQ